MISRISESLGSDAGSPYSQLQHGALNPGRGVEKVLAVFLGVPVVIKNLPPMEGGKFAGQRARRRRHESRDDNLQSPRGTLFFFPYVHLLEVLLRLHVPSPRSWSHDPHFYSGAANSDTQRRASPFSNCGTLSPVIMYVYIHFSGFCSI